MYRNIWVRALRGGLGFLAGALLILLRGWMQSRKPMAGGCFGEVLIIFASGAIGGACLGWTRSEPSMTLRAAVGFGIGAVVTLCVALFAMVSLQGGGKPDVAWGAIGFGVGYAAGGGIGGLFLSPRYALWGALSFGVPAFAAGGLLFYLTGVNASSPIITALGVASVLGPPTIGGAALGAVVGLFGETE